MVTIDKEGKYNFRRNEKVWFCEESEGDGLYLSLYKLKNNLYKRWTGYEEYDHVLNGNGYDSIVAKVYKNGFQYNGTIAYVDNTEY